MGTVDGLILLVGAPTIYMLVKDKLMDSFWGVVVWLLLFVGAFFATGALAPLFSESLNGLSYLGIVASLSVATVLLYIFFDDQYKPKSFLDDPILQLYTFICGFLLVFRAISIWARNGFQDIGALIFSALFLTVVFFMLIQPLSLKIANLRISTWGKTTPWYLEALLILEHLLFVAIVVGLFNAATHMVGWSLFGQAVVMFIVFVLCIVVITNAEKEANELTSTSESG